MTKPASPRRLWRRLRLGAFGLLAAALCPPLWGQPQPMVVTLLGTGTPTPRIERLGPSTLVEAGGQRLVFDVGRGTTIRLQQIGIRLGDVTGVFITHFHSDHTNGIPDLWLTGWLSSSYGGRQAPFRIWGPTGTKALMDGLEKAYQADVTIRLVDQGLPREGIAIAATDFAGESVVFDEGGVAVTAFLVDHGEHIKPAYGYRVQHGKRSVVISGDTRYSENLIKHAKGADLLLHEVATAPAEGRDRPEVKSVLDHHTSAAEVGRLFAQVRPRLAVLTHMVGSGFAGASSRAAAERAALDAALAGARREYTGPLEMGEDLMRFVLGETVEVRRFDHQRRSY
jgi:ribonuclease Z